MPSTYTLNNGIELIATGEQSGTWGDTTNTNFNLLDTALDGQVSVTLSSAGSSGSPNTLPISDGAASNGRNRLVIFGDGGDLGATAYVQLTPNDSEKIIYVRNNLAGSRSILLFQGTYNASNDYEVPAGTTAVVFFNGAGSGAVAANVFNNAHFDALNVVGNATFGGTVTATGTSVFASLDISGDIDVDGTTNLDVVDVDGATNFAADVTFADGADIITATAGTSNVRVGVNAGNSIASGGNYNVVVGDEAGTAITTGDANTAIGYAALDALDTGINNTTVGWSSGGALTQGTRNTAIGYASLDADTLGSKSTALLKFDHNFNTTWRNDPKNLLRGL